jgi:hypothetical protein
MWLAGLSPRLAETPVLADAQRPSPETVLPEQKRVCCYDELGRVWYSRLPPRTRAPLMAWVGRHVACSGEEP